MKNRYNIQVSYVKISAKTKTSAYENRKKTVGHRVISVDVFLLIFEISVEKLKRYRIFELFRFYFFFFCIFISLISLR
jgi:hypothetical protein